MRPWLPPGTCFEPVDRRIAEVVQLWSRSWFGDDDIGLVSATRSGAATIFSGAKPLACAAGAWLLVPDEALQAIARRALHIGPGARATAADVAVLAAVREEALAALRDALSGMLDMVADDSVDTPVTLALATGTLWSIACRRSQMRIGLLMSEVARIELLRRLLPAPSALPRLRPLDLALAPLELELAAHLGRCGITLAELRTLSVGDVLVLEHDLAAALPLVIDGACMPHPSCTVSLEADNLLLEISEPITGTVT